MHRGRSRASRAEWEEKRPIARGNYMENVCLVAPHAVTFSAYMNAQQRRRGAGVSFSETPTSANEHHSPMAIRASILPGERETRLFACRATHSCPTLEKEGQTTVAHLSRSARTSRRAAGHMGCRLRGGDL